MNEQAVGYPPHTTKHEDFPPTESRFVRRPMMRYSSRFDCMHKVLHHEDKSFSEATDADTFQLRTTNWTSLGPAG